MFRHQQPGSHFRSRPSSRGVCSAHRRRISVLETLEARTLLSGSPTAYTVDLTTDTGTGSNNTGDLLYCITQANANPNTAGSEIEFDPTVFQVRHAAVDHPVRHIGSVGNGRAGGDRRPRRERPEDHRQRHRPVFSSSRATRRPPSRA